MFRIRKPVYIASRNKIKEFIDRLMHDAVIFTEMDTRTTMTRQDVVHALHCQVRRTRAPPSY